MNALKTIKQGSIALLAVFAAGSVFAQDIEAGHKKAEVCAACHGATGNPTLPDIPALAGQTPRYLYLELKDFKEGRRSNPQMSPFAQSLSREDMFDLAAYFAAQTRNAPDVKTDAASVARGEAKAKETLCTMCHLGGFVGQNEIPRVAGQQYDYVKKQLADFKAKRRTNDAGNMTSVSSTLSDQDIEDLSQYLTGLR